MSSSMLFRALSPLLLLMLSFTALLSLTRPVAAAVVGGDAKRG